MQSSTPGTTRGAVLLIGLAALLSTIIIACGSPSATTAPPATQAPQPTATVAIAEPTLTGMAMPDTSPGSAEAAPTAMPEPVATEPAVVSSRDSITVVTSGEPVNMDIHSDECSGNIDHLVCQELTVDPFTWIDGTTFEIQGLTGIDRWEQVSPDRWRFFLRPGIIFHNGEPWNAAAAKFGLDLNGTGVNGGGFSQHSFIEGEVVDDLTIDVLCQTATRETRACPIFPGRECSTSSRPPSGTPPRPTRIRPGPWSATARTGSSVGTRASTLGSKPLRTTSPSPMCSPPTTHPSPTSGRFGGRKPSCAPPRSRPEKRTGPTTSASRTLRKSPRQFRPAPTKSTPWSPTTSGTRNSRRRKSEWLWPTLLTARQSLSPCMTAATSVSATSPSRAPWASTSKTRRLTNTIPHCPANCWHRAGYDPENEIRIHTRSGRVYRDIELHEAVIGYWKEVGVNASVQVLENAQATNHRRAGCGKFNQEPGYAEAMDCEERGPAPPINATTHYYETATSNEQLDFARQGTCASAAST